VKRLLEIVEDGHSLEVYFDNFFTSHELLCDLKGAGFRVTGTVRENRLARCPLPSSKDFKKEQRRAYDYRFDADNDILVVKWQDNNVVSVVSNHLSLDPIRPVERRVKGQMGKTAVQQPHPLKQYNRYMSGIDLRD
jgi:hypothetical protein